MMTNTKVPAIIIKRMKGGEKKGGGGFIGESKVNFTLYTMQLCKVAI